MPTRNPNGVSRFRVLRPPAVMRPSRFPSIGRFVQLQNRLESPTVMEQNMGVKRAAQAIMSRYLVRANQEQRRMLAIRIAQEKDVIPSKNDKKMMGVRLAWLLAIDELRVHHRMSFRSLGFSPRELRSIGFDETLVALHGYSARELLLAGVNPVHMFPVDNIYSDIIPKRMLKTAFGRRLAKKYSTEDALHRMRAEGLSDELIVQLYLKDGDISMARYVLRHSNNIAFKKFDPKAIFGLMQEAKLSRDSIAHFFDYCGWSEIAKKIKSKGHL